MTERTDLPPADGPAAPRLGEEGHDVIAAAAAERRDVPGTAVEAADLADTYESMMRLADLFDSSGEQLRQRAKLGSDLLADPSFTESAPLSPATFTQAEDDVRAATTGKTGLLSRSLELDADALVLRATVLTYQWIDDLQTAAYRTLGSIAGRAIGYLAPEVALGGAIVSAGLIETDALDRDGVAAYLSELAEANPDLMEHVTTGGGGLLDSLRMRSLLTSGLRTDSTAATRGGLRAVGAPEFDDGIEGALRDVGGSLVEPVSDEQQRAVTTDDGDPPRSLADLVRLLEATPPPVAVRRAGPGRFVALLPGRPAGAPGAARLVDGDPNGGREHLREALLAAISADAEGAGSEPARVMLVGAGQGGLAAAELAASGADGFMVEQVVTVGSPSAHVPRIPDGVRVLSLEDSADPVALLGSLMSAGTPNRVTVVFDGGRAADDSVYVTGARAADQATHPELRAEIARLHQLGYLAP